MSGISIEMASKDDPAIMLTVARARAIVRLINQAAELLRSFRSSTGFSQEKMADLLEVSQPRIAQLESGKPGNAPSLEQLAEYAFHTGNELSICDSAHLVAVEEEKRALMQQIRECDAQVRAQKKQIDEQRQRIRVLEGRLMMLTHATPEPPVRFAASEPPGIAVLLREYVSRLFADDEFPRRYLTKPQVQELASTFQMCLNRRTSVGTVLDTVSGVIQRRAGAL